MQPFVHLSIVFWLNMALLYWRSMLLNFFVFHTSRGISSRLSTLLFLIFLSTKSSSSCVNCPSLTFSWLQIISLIGSSIIFTDFPSKFLKCCFHRCICSSWLVTFSLALAVLFLLLTLFTVCHVILDCVLQLSLLSYWSDFGCILFVLLGIC